MKHEFHAQYALAIQDSTTQAFVLDWLVGKSPKAPRRWPEILDLHAKTDDFARLMVLTQAIGTRYKDQARAGGRKEPGGLDYWIRHKSEAWLQERLNVMRDVLGFKADSPLAAPLPDLASFLPGAWTVRIPFTLRKPYLSRDDTDFYLLDGPVRKEWVFKVPCVAPSQWKGALRAAMMKALLSRWQGPDDVERSPENFAARRFRLALLFGDEKGEEPGALKGLAGYLDQIGGKEAADIFRRKVRKYFRAPDDKPMPHFRGRLHFYPTFFDKLGMEVINPHDRETGVGARGPILMECVPAGSQGTFTLLYVPFGPCTEEREEVRQETWDPLKMVADGVKAMLTEYGFGAKTSSGYGVAEIVRDHVAIRPESMQDRFLSVMMGAENGQ